MAHADETAAAAGDRVPFWNRLTAAKSMGGYAVFMAHPAYQRLLSAEPWFKRLIPILIITFLSLIGLARAIQLSENRTDTLQTAKENLTLIASLIVERFDDVAPDLQEAALKEHLTATLAEALPIRATKNGRKLFIVKNDGFIYADAPISSGYRGTYLADILNDTQALLTFGKSAGVQTVSLIENGDTTFVTLHHLPHDLGAIAIYQPQDAILANWRADVSLNASIFLGTGVLLSVVLFAFFSQTSRAEEADLIYQETYARFDTALSRGKCGLWDWDVSRGRMFWSPSMYEILGLEPRHNLMGFGEIDQLVHPDDVDLLQTAENVLTRELTQIDQIYRMRHIDGHWVWVRARGEVVEHPNKESLHLVGICIDVSEQIKLSEENKTANMRLRESIESLSEAFVLWDQKNRLVVCNEKYRELNGIARELVVPGAPYAEIMSNAQTPQPALHANIVNDEGPIEHPTEHQLEDGRWLQIDEIRTRDGGYVSIGTDITRIKRNEEALLVREQELQTSVLELEKSEKHLQELAEKLTIQRELAESANMEKSAFLANISHEWRTPLNAIIGFSDVMKSGVFGPLGSDKYTEYCDDINHAGTYMLAFINDVLDMSEIEAGRFDLNHEKVNISEVILSCVDAVKGDTHTSEVNLTVDVPESLPIMADRRAMKQIIHNLLSNALKFNKQGGQIKVTCAGSLQNLAITISDTGIGIDPDILPEIGKPFKQVQSQFTKNHTGSGLGLAISKSLVEMHGGTLEIESNLNVGTNIRITLPINAQEETAAA